MRCVASFLNTYHVFMSKEDHVLLVEMYLAMMQRSPTDYKNVDHCSKLVRRLLKKVWVLSEHVTGRRAYRGTFLRFPLKYIWQL